MRWERAVVPRGVLPAMTLMAAGCLWAPSLLAQELGSNGQALDTSRYGIDLYQGAVWAGSRVTSLGGSYVAVAYDVDGMLQNPAAPAVRPDFSVSDFDYWLGFGATFPSSLEGMDFFNSGNVTELDGSADSLIYLTPAAILQFGPFGVGANIEFQSYGLSDVDDGSGNPTRISNNFTQTHIQTAYAFAEGEYVVGGGIRILQMATTIGETLIRAQSQPIVATGVGAELGVLYKPRGQRFQLGAAYRSGITAQSRFSDDVTLDGDNNLVITTSSGQFYMPERAELPWDINLGVSFGLGKTPENRPWRSDYDVAEREILELRRRYLALRDEARVEISKATTKKERAMLEEHYRLALQDLEAAIAQVKEEGYWKLQAELASASRNVGFVTASLLISGSVVDAVGVESFVTQTVNRSGEQLVFSPRLGSEVEVVPNWFRVRSGTYLEPTRFDTSEPRPHYAGGVDIPLGVWNVFGLWPDDYRWRLAGSFDIARQFSTFGFSVAGWYPRHNKTVNRPKSKKETQPLLLPPVDPWPIVRPER